MDTQINRRSLLTWRLYIIVPLGLMLSVGAFTLLGSTPSISYVREPATVVAASNNEALEYVEWIPELPVRLVIPSLNIDAKVQHVGLAPNGQGEMDVPSNFTDVGWYKEGVRPGMLGSAVMTGHLNGKGVPEGVFFLLHQLEVGDEVVIVSENRIEDIFQVVKIKTYAYNDPTTDVFLNSDGKKRLNLITCGGEWLPSQEVYNERTVVFTELITDVE